MKLLKRLSISFVAATFMWGCASSAEINQQAEQSYAQVLQQARAKKVLDTSSKTAKRIHAVFNKMRPYAEQENTTGEKFNWQIAVVRSNELNAWAMPGGKMMFYTGLVENLKLTDDEIATVMGHEMAHALKEHGKSSHNFGTATGIIGSIGGAVVNSKFGVNAELVTTGVDLIADKPYSRSHETEADEVGLILMAKAGYNPQSAPKLWQKMQAQGSSNSGVASLFSTHPSDASRQENLERLMPEALKYYKK